MDKVQIVRHRAGAAGLATAASCYAAESGPLMLDRGEMVGQTWAERYDRLHASRS